MNSVMVSVASPWLVCFRRQAPDTPQRRFITLQLSVLGFISRSTCLLAISSIGHLKRGPGFTIRQLARGSARPKRVRRHTDR